MKYFLYLICFVLTPTLFAQSAKKDIISKELKEVVKEADLLFSYRLMEWWGSELTERQKELDKQVADYILYHDADKLYFVLLRSEEHTSELQSRGHLVCRLLLE